MWPIFGFSLTKPSRFTRCPGIRVTPWTTYSATGTSCFPSATQFWHSRQYRLQHTVSSAGAVPITKREPFTAGSAIRGDSKRVYEIQEFLLERRLGLHLMCLYKASSTGKTFILETLLDSFDYQKSLQQPLSSSPNLRAFIDTISEESMFVYEFLPEDLFQLSKRPLAYGTRKNILKRALEGLAELHDRGILHTDIKPNNIPIDYDHDFTNVPEDNNLTVNQVRISDLEELVLLGPGECIEGCLSGNELWRSPESWARAEQYFSSDLFSFAVVAIYVMLEHMMFLASSEELKGDRAWWHVLWKHTMYFGDVDGVEGLLWHTGEENPFHERLKSLIVEFGDHNPRGPFAKWKSVDNAAFQDLIAQMTSLHPKRRITAREALQHPWFRGTESS
ncbi:kinase-like protein [Parathielavia hyrcaniae]|uniref:Kinase-like protein n=1 Tax=Parathielavia hyrcaniae TaxID=113614 RepID=A0AAN6SXQ3_9PEZI|nr:kinase-like protein [Parathielavia hyrcaniae]